MDTSTRTRDLAAIHVAKKALGLTDEAYRDRMARVCNGVRSAALLDAAGRQRFLAHLAACQRARAAAAPKPARRPLKPHERKIWALWMELADCGLVEHRTLHAINAWTHRQTRIDDIALLDRRQQQVVIESLKQWLKRGHEAEQPAG